MRVVRDVAVVLLAFAALGVGCAFLWHAWWAPAPVGFVYEGAPYFLPDQEFRATGMYVAVAAPAGVLLGVLCAAMLRRDELVTLVSVLVGAGLAAVVMALVGHALGPASAEAASKGLENWAEVRADLAVDGLAPWLAFPAGAVTGAFMVLVGGGPKSRHEEGSDPVAHG